MEAEQALRFPKPFVHGEVIAHIARVAGERVRAGVPDPGELLVAADHIPGRRTGHRILRAITRSNDRPDVLFRYRDNVVVVEVGGLSRRFKWLGQFSMVHVKSGEEVKFVPRDRSWFASLVADQIRESMEPYRWKQRASMG